jgi:NADH-quinone oxidoreductase subunit M
MASLGLPGLAGFWGEFPAILSAYEPANAQYASAFFGVSNLVLFRVFMVVAALGTVLAAGYLLWLFQRVAMGEPTEEFADDPHIHDVVPTEWVAWVPLLVLIVVLGFYPNLMFQVTNPAVTQSMAQVAAAVGAGG